MGTTDMDSDACWNNIPDPTSLNAQRQLGRLFESLPHDSPLIEELRAALSQNALLPTLSQFMLRPSLTVAIAWAFRPLLMDLCVRWLDTDEGIWGKLDALGMLIEIHEELFPILSSLLRCFGGGPLRVLLNEQMPQEISCVSLHRVLLAYHRVLRATPSLPRNLNWDLACLLTLCDAPDVDRGSRWLAIRCYSLQSNMSESVRLRMEQDALGEIYDEDCPIIYEEDMNGTVKEVDGWILPVLEERRVRDYRNAILNSPDYFAGSEESDIVIKETDLSPRVANVQGILLLRSPSPTPISSSLVITSSARLTLRRLAVNISLRRPTLLTSAPSSGKTTFLNHLAGVLYPSFPNQVITIHLADTSLDPRSLIGSYVSSTTSAGSFEWKDGVLVKAMSEGRWVVFKDIDRASNEVLGLISSLVESMDDVRPIGSNATLSLGSRGTVEAAESFALFATRSVEGQDIHAFPPLTFLGAQKWQEIVVPENSLDDLRLIVDSKFPIIAGPVSDSLIDIWLTVKRLRVVSSTRTIGIRDLEKFCSRISHLLAASRTVPSHQRQSCEASLSISSLFPHPSIREEIYLDARDVFFAAGALSKPSLEQRETIAKAIGKKLDLSDETCEWVLTRRTPAFEIEKDVDGRPVTIRAGRTALSVNPVNRLSDPLPVHPFSMHKQALRLLSQIAACVGAVEPVLLTGETGTGKTSVISHFASLLNKPLVSLNLSNQTESSDLIGGFRPVSARVPALELQHRFTELFQKSFSSKRNEQLLQNLRKALSIGKWKSVVKLWSETAKTAIEKLKEKELDGDVLRPDETVGVMDSPMPRKRRRVQGDTPMGSIMEWTAFEGDVRNFEVQHVLDKGKFSFHFVEGPLVKSIRTGAWVLLDEINLASPETLECIAGLLQGPGASITLTERGSLEPVPRHAEFRLFACMNPATDVGKKDLPGNIRARFTEIEVPPPDDDREALMSVIVYYIGHLAVTDKTAVSDIADFYTSVKRLAAAGRIADGSNHRPHYSMRSLSRALTFAVDTVQIFGLRRALWEGFVMTFTMVLDHSSTDIVLGLARDTLLSNIKNKAHFLTILPPPPQNGLTNSHVQVGSFWLSSGPSEREEATDYILTPSVQKKLVDLARIVMTKRYPILIEGPTSSGKTSAIQYLARRTGHHFVRINNHEHTDIQEYLGSYVSDPKSGKLVFRDGLLVRALRRGDWIVLDELNLAPTDVLEALNRLLDDNRELVVPETQEIVRPHPHFMLFATQNPSGVYAGRKVLSRALRNRFLEVHFEDVPAAELEHILSQRSLIAPSHSQRIVAVFQELQKQRQMARIFEGKEGFATLRDLFRWAGRGAEGYQELAENGYMLLAERTRRREDKLVVKEIIEKVMKVSITESSLYNMDRLSSSAQSCKSIVWTNPMRRLFILLSHALRHNEPVLLVGETGSGKTSVCQVYAEVENKVLRTVNCHQNSEAADIIGGLRPVRQDSSLEPRVVNKIAEILGIRIDANAMDNGQLMHLITSRLGEELGPRERDILVLAQSALSSNRGLLAWQDGPLVKSMRSGDVFLLDEISLADDSVLERLNSVLEPARTLVLAEKGGENADEFEMVANSGFKFVATMNPGGDFGKKELSPALRNRFTEIWVPSLMEREELAEIVKQSWKHDELTQLTEPLLDFVDWIISEVNDSSLITLRDILSWVDFCNSLFPTTGTPSGVLFVQGGEMSVLDGLFSLTQLFGWSINSLRALHERARHRLVELCPDSGALRQVPSFDVSVEGDEFRIGLFSIPFGPQPSQLKSFSFNAPTSLENAFRLIRACQVRKPILLEGGPGVGKTSLVTALAAAAGQTLYRINLSEQTDLVDLFGSDLPVEGHASGSFGWSDAKFLQALKNGDWVLLDEMNLASQSVLEGLNAVFDHRASVYIPELDRTFPRHPSFRVFAAQNPLNQGSGRKGLPKSFLNRFTKVYVEQLSPTDLLLICQHLFPAIAPSVLQRMITFSCRLQEDVVVRRRFGMEGAPWEFNLRDLLRWASLMIRPNGTIGEPWEYVNAIYRSRFRTESDRTALLDLFADVFNDTDITRKIQPRLIRTSQYVVCGSSRLRKGLTMREDGGARLLPTQINSLESSLWCLSRNWLVILTGPHSTGKTSFARALAAVSGRPLEELSLGSSSDTSDLIGSFEQTSIEFNTERLLTDLLCIIDSSVAQAHLENTGLLVNLLKLKIEAIAARRTRDFTSLQSIIRSCLDIPLLDTLDWNLKASLESLSALCLNGKASPPQFAWIDGPLIQAMRRGQWLLLDNANLCSPSVLDRLNSLCETNGSIVLTERGVDQEVVYPHPDFRLIMTVDPCHGEISRAMRNRGIEVALGTPVMKFDAVLLRDAKRLALRHVYSRPTFDLLRRAMHSLTEAQSDGNMLTPVIHWDNKDAISSQMRVAEALYEHSSGSDATAITLFVFSYSSPLSYKGLLRLCKSVNNARAYFLLENLFSSRQDSNDLRNVLIDFARPRQLFDELHRPLHPFIFYPCDHWLSDGDRRSCLLISLILEACVLAASMELDLCGIMCTNANYSGSPIQAVVSKEHEYTTRFVVAVPKLVRKAILELQNSNENSLSDIEVLLDLIHYATLLHQASNQVVPDFSTLYAVSGWIHQLSKLVPHLLEGLREEVQTLHRKYLVSSGQRVGEIWVSLYHPSMPPCTVDLLNQLHMLPSGTQKYAVDLITLTAASREDNDDLIKDLKLIRNSLVQSDNGRQFVEPATSAENNLTMLTIEMNEMASLGPSVYKSRLGDIVRLLRQSVTLAKCAPRFIAYQLLLWKVDAKLGMIPELVNAHLEWHRALWTSTTSFQTMGLSMLYTPIFLRSATGSSDFHGTLKEIDLKQALQKDCVAYALSERFQPQDRESLALGFLLRNVELVLYMCFPELVDHDFQDEAFISDYRATIRHLDGILQHGAYEPFSSLRPALKEISRCPSWTGRLHAVGRCWVILSQILLSLYVPDIPIDPARVQSCRQSFQKSQIQWLQSQSRVYSSWEQCRTGHHENVITAILRDRLRRLEATLDADTVGNDLSLRGDLSLLQAFWSETRGFVSEIMSSERLERFICATITETGDILGQELLFQDAITNYLHRMKNIYSPLQDLMRPIELAMMQLRFGLTALRHSSVVRSSPSVCSNVQEIIAFPSVHAKDAALLSSSEELVRSGLPLNEALLLQLTSIPRMGGRANEPRQKLFQIQCIYERMMTLWDTALVDRAEKAQQAESLYRSRPFANKSADGDPDDEDVQQLFPTYSEDDGGKQLDAESNGQTSPDIRTIISAGFSRKLLNIHLLLFGNNAECFRGEYSSSWRSLRLQLVRCWVDGPLSSLSCNTDDESLAFRLDILHDVKHRFQHSERRNAYSFYRDANLPEARKGAAVVKGLREKLTNLILFWPDQLVLQHLRDRCDNVLSMNMNSPVAKMLGAIERLLLHTEDWEIFANRDNSLMAHRQSLMDLIVSWRRLELTGWKSVLDWEAQSFCDELSDWWFRLYDATVRGAIAAYQGPDGGALDGYLDSMEPLIEDFVTSSPLGQFNHRLKMIHSFASMTSRLASVDGPSQNPIKRVAQTLFAIYQFYNQFSDKIDMSFAEQRVTIEKEVLNLVKLATWRDVNVHALQQSAQKTHRQLYKRIRLFRELLRQPVIRHLRISDSNPHQITNYGDDEAPFVEVPNKPVVSRGPPKVVKFSSILTSGLKDILNPFSTSAIEELSVTIITMEKKYATSAPRKDLSLNERKRWNSALFARKKRSWYDFLKELKRIGLSPNVKPGVLQRHRNRRFVMDQPSIEIPEGTSFGAMLTKINCYFFRSICLLRDLLQYDANHHPDVATRELKRGVSSFESAFSFTMSARVGISDLTKKWNHVLAFVHRFRELERSQGACISIPTIKCAVQDVTLKITETAEALNELLDVATNIADLSEDVSSINAEVLSNIRGWISRSADFSEQLTKLLRALERSNFITEDDLGFIQQSLKHLESVKLLLTDVSDREPSLKRFCSSIQGWFDQRLINTSILYSALSAHGDNLNSTIDVDTVIDLLLIIGQDLLEVDHSCKESKEDDSNHIHRQHAMFLQVSRILRMDSLLLRLQQLAGSFHGSSLTARSAALSQLLPFLDSYIAFAERYLALYSAWTKSLLKLTYISGILLRTVATSGFCKPPEADEAEGADGGVVESVEGTGLGQGEGKENVSNQIEDESQFEGVKDQNDEGNDQQTGDGDDEAIDVDFDLGGPLEDGPEKDAISDEDSMTELDDEFGQNISDDVKPVDEEFWNEQMDDKRTQDQDISSGDGKSGEPEMVAKDQEDQASETRAKEKQEQGICAADKERDVTEGVEPDLESKPEPEPELRNEGTGAQLDNAANSARSEDDPEESTQPEEQDALNDMENISLDEELIDVENEGRADYSESVDQEEEEAESKGSEADFGDGETGEEGFGEAASKADMHAGNEGDNNANLGMADASGSREDLLQAPDETSADLPPNRSRDAEPSASAGPSAETTNKSMTAPSAQFDANSASRALEFGQKSTLSLDEPLPNPHRSLGDALREVRRRFDNIMEATGAESHTTADNGPEAKQTALEYVADESQDVDMQALGPALGEETAKLNQLSLIDEDEPRAATIPEETSAPEDVTEERTEVPRQTQADSKGRRQEKEPSKQSKDAGLEAMNVDTDHQDVCELPDLVADEQELSQAKKVELDLSKWLREGQPEEDAQRIWQLFDNLTQTLSFSLCEQLRLILEPTRATRLMGDFRTGKRLNMKKIIPYIASNYTKDKIWLRRVRPSQREYQVLIALDDSKSMAESHSIHLAFQTLALVSKALNRLEVGDIAIASFGERMQMVHGFEDGPFTEQAGTKVIETFKFAQTATDVRSLLESSVEVLTRARERRVSSSSSDLWQLEIIISDGICQDHEELRAIMRKAEEEHILIVFIVIDAHNDPSVGDSAGDASRGQNSIVNMSQAMYRTVNGRLELHMQRYLDSFPFEFFVILKNVETLPDVLADTLRQFFERISAS